jgi:predicted membrane protein
MNSMIIIGGALILIGGWIVGRMTYKFLIFSLKLLLGLFLIYMGYHITQSPPPHYGQITKWFNTENLILNKTDRLGITRGSTSTFEVFTVLKGTGVIDLSSIPVGQEDITVIVNSIFSDTTVLVDPNTPLSIHSTLLQGSASISGANPITSGDLNFVTEAAAQSKHTLTIHGNAVWGKLNFTAPPPSPAAAAAAAASTPSPGKK